MGAEEGSEAGCFPWAQGQQGQAQQAMSSSPCHHLVHWNASQFSDSPFPLRSFGAGLTVSSCRRATVSYLSFVMAGSLIRDCELIQGKAHTSNFMFQHALYTVLCNPKVTGVWLWGRSEVTAIWKALKLPLPLLSCLGKGSPGPSERGAPWVS